MEDGWRKVGESGGGYVVATLFNVDTKESKSVCVRDYDYSDCSRDDDYWYDAPIDKDAVVMWRKENGIIGEGVDVVIVKGRKLPIGYTGKIVKMRKVYDCYDRWIVKNCAIVG